MSSAWDDAEGLADGHHDPPFWTNNDRDWAREFGEDWAVWPQPNNGLLPPFDHNLNSPFGVNTPPRPPSPPQHFVESLRHRRTQSDHQPPSQHTSAFAPAPAPAPNPAASSSTIPPSSRTLPRLGELLSPTSRNVQLPPISNITAPVTPERGNRPEQTTPQAPSTYRPTPFTWRDLLEDDARGDLSSDYAGEDGIDLDGLDELFPEDAEMARRSRHAHDSFTPYDLTGEPSASAAAAAASPHRPPRARRRSVIDAASTSRTLPRKRRADEISGNNTTTQHDDTIESVDLTTDAAVADAALAQTIAQQQSAAARAGVADKPQRLGQLQCIICMEPFTNATTTHCGHIYCHECLTQALLASAKSSDNGVGHCPVCRKAVSKRRQNQIVPIAFMKRSAFRGKTRQQN